MPRKTPAPCEACDGGGTLEVQDGGPEWACNAVWIDCPECAGSGLAVKPTPRLTDAEAIARITAAGRGVEEHKRLWQNGFISEAAYQATVQAAMAEIRRILAEAGHDR